MVSSWTILVIEDEAKIQQVIRKALEPHYQVYLASDGAEGLRQARTVNPDLILLDLRMPRMDGLSVLAKLKGHEETRAIPVVIVSAKGETESLLEGQRAGAIDYLIKPLNLQDLYGVIQRQVAVRGG